MTLPGKPAKARRANQKFMELQAKLARRYHSMTEIGRKRSLPQNFQFSIVVPFFSR
jgi:hypothetical protein